ncbi:hypothetical protein EV356DRAFT_15875 [Viridothelium virens]|uniref:Ig-like domain-containing protein n=1 Tax=Viridothelium virens TaxID=1048519 RepID=A0A6A6HHW1_VIRVR|nr:hypothetical protein EV356DRAFT_15875 [Viridothelium virens]
MLLLARENGVSEYPMSGVLQQRCAPLTGCYCLCQRSLWQRLTAPMVRERVTPEAKPQDPSVSQIPMSSGHGILLCTSWGTADSLVPLHILLIDFAWLQMGEPYYKKKEVFPRFINGLQDLIPRRLSNAVLRLANRRQCKSSADVCKVSA